MSDHSLRHRASVTSQRGQPAWLIVHNVNCCALNSICKISIFDEKNICSAYAYVLFCAMCRKLWAKAITISIEKRPRRRAASTELRLRWLSFALWLWLENTYSSFQMIIITIILSHIILVFFSII